MLGHIFGLNIVTLDIHTLYLLDLKSLVGAIFFFFFSFRKWMNTFVLYKDALEYLLVKHF